MSKVTIQRKTEHFGTRLRRVREAKGLTQVQVQRALGVEQAHLSMIERKGQCRLALLGKLAKFYGVTLDELVFGEETAA